MSRRSLFTEVFITKRKERGRRRKGRRRRKTREKERSNWGSSLGGVMELNYVHAPETPHGKVTDHD